MLKFPFLKADLSRWFSTFNVFSIGKVLLLLIAPFSLLFAYGQVQSAEREVAEQKVEQLTADVKTLARSLAMAEAYNASREASVARQTTDTRVLSYVTDEVLDMPAPIDVIDILRPYTLDSTDD
jgi:hypothetical protein